MVFFSFRMYSGVHSVVAVDVWLDDTQHDNDSGQVDADVASPQP